MENSAHKKPIRIVVISDAYCCDAGNNQAHREQFEIVAQLPDTHGLMHQLQQHQPDILLIDIEHPTPCLLEHLTTIQAYAPTPVIVCCPAENSEFIQNATRAGVYAYVPERYSGARPEPAIVYAAMARFESRQTLHRELKQAQSKLAKISPIEQAKRLLMQHKSITEQQAHEQIRTLSMQTNASMPDIASAIIKRLGRDIQAS
ncbi:MAG: ANTAR domain-containing protein [Porticoccaceae bacterium]|nr:ANTAR domain-containing protein [Porticoccaceae bacterium]